MKKNFIFANVTYVILIIMAILNGNIQTEPEWMLLLCITLTQIFMVYKYKKGVLGSANIASIIYVTFILWEIMTKYWGILNPVLCPPLEDIFYVFYSQWQQMLVGVLSSLELLMVGFAVALTFGVILGIAIGWIKSLSDVLYPIVKVLAPIPSVIYTPYIVAVMPTFRSASAMVIILGLFFPLLLQMINRVHTMDKRIINTARAMNVSHGGMIFKVILPYCIPGIVGGIKVSLSTSIMILTLAEMMGATSGMGYFIKNYADFANYTFVIAGIILVGIVVTILNKIVVFIEQRTIRWI